LLYHLTRRKQAESFRELGVEEIETNWDDEEKTTENCMRRNIILSIFQQTSKRM